MMNSNLLNNRLFKHILYALSTTLENPAFLRIIHRFVNRLLEGALARAKHPL